MGRKIKGRNHRPCESANIQANINADPTMEEIAASDAQWHSSGHGA